MMKVALSFLVMDSLPVGLLMEPAYKNWLVHVADLRANFRAFSICIIGVGVVDFRRIF